MTKAFIFNHPSNMQMRHFSVVVWNASVAAEVLVLLVVLIFFSFVLGNVIIIHKHMGTKIKKVEIFLTRNNWI